MTTKPTAAQMRTVLLRYGREIVRGERVRNRNGLNTPSQVRRYCAALQRVWEMAEKIAREDKRHG